VKDASKQKALRFAQLSIQHPDLDHINLEQCQKRDDYRAPKGEESLRALLTESPPVLLKRMGGSFDVDTGSARKVQI
jgi:hypothetical protein